MIIQVPTAALRPAMLEMTAFGRIFLMSEMV